MAVVRVLVPLRVCLQVSRLERADGHRSLGIISALFASRAPFSTEHRAGKVPPRWWHLPKSCVAAQILFQPWKWPSGTGEDGPLDNSWKWKAQLLADRAIGVWSLVWIWFSNMWYIASNPCFWVASFWELCRFRKFACGCFIGSTETSATALCGTTEDDE